MGTGIVIDALNIALNMSRSKDERKFLKTTLIRERLRQLNINVELS